MVLPGSKLMQSPVALVLDFTIDISASWQRFTVTEDEVETG